MIEKVTTVYIADDGKKFSNKEDCIKYEKENAYYAEIKKALKEVREICKNHICDNCPLAHYDECFSRNDEGTDCVEPCDWTF